MKRGITKLFAEAVTGVQKTELCWPVYNYNHIMILYYAASRKKILNELLSISSNMLFCLKGFRQENYSSLPNNTLLGELFLTTGND